MIGDKILSLIASAKLNFRMLLKALVNPQPGQGIPVKNLKGQQ